MVFQCSVTFRLWSTAASCLVGRLCSVLYRDATGELLSVHSYGYVCYRGFERTNEAGTRQILRHAGEVQHDLHSRQQERTMEQQQQQIPATATSLTSATTAARGTYVMDEALRPWPLYDISGAQDPESLDEMKDLFRRFRALRQKPVDGVDHSALQESWCAFIRRWNRPQAQEENFVD
ncbi:hypothetical protein PInf_025759 [Phytophthora infestans]|nr:hypothetical protein PInf_025759 [Phytophthora infestans]